MNTPDAKQLHWIDVNTSSRWLDEFHKLMIRCKNVVLYGNVSDQFLFNGEYCTASQFLEMYFHREGYEIVGSYDVVDGFRFPDDKQKGTMFKQFRKVVQAKHREEQERLTAHSSDGGESSARPGQPVPAPSSGAGPGAAQPGLASAVGGATANAPQAETPADIARRLRGEAPASSGTSGASLPQPMHRPPQPGTGQPQEMVIRSRQLALEPALDAIRRLLGQADRSAAMVVNFADKLVTRREQSSDDERKRLIQLMKMVENAAFLSQAPLERRKNALVIVAHQLDAIPEWLYKDSPFLSLVKIGLPQKDERIAFARRFRQSFWEGAHLDNEAMQTVAEDFANLTEGLSAWDLDAVLRTSIEERIPLRETKKLLNFYKHGIVEDPWASISSERIQRSAQTIQQRVIGQNHAVRAVCDMLITAQVGISMSDVTAAGGKPKGVFFFVGPTGVGKTELAKAMTQLIFSDESAFARFDMSEYAEEHAAERLTGAPPSFVGYEEGGQLTNRVQERPFSLLLFDEIEKAHGRIMDKFLQILEDGRMTDGKGQTSYFSQTAIIFTSNIGSTELKEYFETLPDDDELPPYSKINEIYTKAVRDHFIFKLKRPEILNRLGNNILVFDILRPQHVEGICSKFLNLLVQSALARKEIQLEFPEGSVRKMISKLMTRNNLSFGGRQIKNIMETHVERPLNRWILEKKAAGIGIQVVADVDGRSIVVNGEKVEFQDV